MKISDLRWPIIEYHWASRTVTVHQSTEALMQIVSLNTSESAAIKDMPDYDTLKHELRWTKRCIHVLSLLVALLLLTTLGMLCLAIFGFVRIGSSSIQFSQPL